MTRSPCLGWDPSSFFVAALLLVGCSRGSANLAGNWRGVRSEGVTADGLASANAFAGRMRLEVKGSSITVIADKDSHTDHYKKLTEDKAKTVIQTDLEGENDPQTFVFADATNMKWMVTPSQAIVFVKE